MVKWRSIQIDAFIVCMFAHVYFPRTGYSFDVALARFFQQKIQKKTVVPMILAETMFTLNPNGFLKCSVSLLYTCMIGHRISQESWLAFHFLFDLDSKNFRTRQAIYGDENNLEFFLKTASEDNIGILDCVVIIF